MFSKFFATAALAGALLIGEGTGGSPAYAADLGNDRTDADYGHPALAGGAFQGFAVGVHAGGQFTNVEIGDGGFSFDGIGADGVVGGVHAEYLFGVGRWRIGPYVEGGLSNVNTNIEFGPSGGDILEQTHYYGGGLKIGATIFNASLLYAKIGLERSHWDVVESFEAEVDSLVLGGGLATMVAEHTSLGLELNYLDTINVEANGSDVSDLFDETEGFRGLVRLNYQH